MITVSVGIPEGVLARFPENIRAHISQAVTQSLDTGFEPIIVDPQVIVDAINYTGRGPYVTTDAGRLYICYYDLAFGRDGNRRKIRFIPGLPMTHPLNGK